MITFRNIMNGVALFLLFNFSEPVYSQKIVDVDFIGDARYSTYNFTDAVVPYNGLDGWVEGKFSWNGKRARLAPYLSLMGSYMYFPFEKNKEIKKLFGWQRYLSCGLGMQYYPFFQGEGKYSPLSSIRIFALFSGKIFEGDILKEPKAMVPYTNYIHHDICIGIDYYYDNLFCDKSNFLCRNNLVVIGWTNFAYKKTNFRIDNFNTFSWAGNLKIGYKFHTAKNVYPIIYLANDFTIVPFCKSCAWWENYLHWGGGIRIYPFSSTGKNSSPVIPDFLKRFHFFGEYWLDGVWVRNKPPNQLEGHDLRLGLGFSSSGLIKKM